MIGCGGTYLAEITIMDISIIIEESRTQGEECLLLIAVSSLHLRIEYLEVQQPNNRKNHHVSFFLIFLGRTKMHKYKQIAEIVANIPRRTDSSLM